ncbi:MBL fold metallo-hydrolase [Patescibacteria group bacterium]|nr:MBL fold metallo-hydrolase [Patescibacteria group bacterium]MBU1931442.1 MBL fold metallo-hydrolase [Patescibacteria group bacterium]
MKITLLCENETSEAGWDKCVSEWGFSAFIQSNGVNILFDTGSTDIYWRNAKKLKINLEDTHFVVLSHFHLDHTGGLRYHNFKTKKKMIIHPQILEKLPPSECKKVKNDFEIIRSKKPFEFSPGIFYLGEIPRKTDFEKGMFENDKMLDDSALAIKTKSGVVVLTGCSHSGICNICEYAKEVTGQKLYSVIGGFHLFEEEDQKAVDGTIEYFKAEKIERLYPMHCVDFPTLVRFHNEFKTKKYGTGDVIKFGE